MPHSLPPKLTRTRGLHASHRENWVSSARGHLLERKYSLMQNQNWAGSLIFANSIREIWTYTGSPFCLVVVATYVPTASKTLGVSLILIINGTTLASIANFICCKKCQRDDCFQLPFSLMTSEEKDCNRCGWKWAFTNPNCFNRSWKTFWTRAIKSAIPQ